MKKKYNFTGCGLHMLLELEQTIWVILLKYSRPCKYCNADLADKNYISQQMMSLANYL
jgi:hypothetical protein